MGKKLTFSETCLEPLWNQPETPSSSPSQTLCSFGYWIIELFCFLVAGMMCWSLCFGFIAGALSSASFPGKGQSPVSAPKSVWNRSETTLKHLPAHHFRIFLCMWVVGLRMAFFCGFRPFSDLFQTNWAVASNLQTQGSSSFLWLQRILPLLLLILTNFYYYCRCYCYYWGYYCYCYY